jgi:hypothetical protein
VPRCQPDVLLPQLLFFNSCCAHDLILAFLSIRLPARSADFKTAS